MKTKITHALLSALSLLLTGSLFVTLSAGCASKPVIIQDDDEQIYQQSFGTGTTTSAAGDPTGESGDTTGESGEATDMTNVNGSTKRPDGTTTRRPSGNTTVSTSTTSTTAAPILGVKRTVSQVKTVNGTPRLFVNGQMTSGNMLFINGDMSAANVTDAFKRQVSYASENGLNLFSTIYNINYTYKAATNKDLVFNSLKSRLDTIIDMDEDAQILLRISVIGPPSVFGDSETASYNGKKSGRVSIASDAWIEETVARVKDVVTYIRSQKDYADHVFGYHLDCGEWFPEEFTVCADTSPTNNREFREWLTAKYKTDAALQKAWGTTAYSLANATVPSDQLSSSHAGLFLSTADTRYADYYDYWSEMTASRVNAIAKAIKEASNNENVVIAFFGYYFEQYHASTGHWDFRSLLESQYLDGFASPTSYMDRANGSNPNVATSGYMTTVDSVIRAGKLWIMESDERTFLNTTGRTESLGIWTPISTIEDILEVHKREIAIAMIHGASMYPMDLSGYGWYDDVEIWENFGKLDKTYLAYASASKKQAKYEVALVVDEDAGRLVSQPFGVGNPGLARAMLDIYRAGISFALVEQEDLLLGCADDYKVYIFVNPYRLTSAEINTLSAKLHTGNKTAVYLYSFGNASAADIKKLTGMNMTTTNAKASHALTLTSQNKLTGLVGLPAPTANPRTTVTGGYTTELGKYSDGTVGAALYEAGNYKSVFIGTAGLGTPSSIRALARYGGANIFIDTNDVLVANDNMVMLHASSRGNKTVNFSGKVDVYDYFENKWYTNVSSVTLSNMRSGTCRWLFYGKKAEIEAMKLPAWKK